MPRTSTALDFKVQGAVILRAYPIHLQLKDRTAAVIGGGKVAERKTRSLLDAGAVITVISPVVTSAIQSWVGEGRVLWKNKTFQRDDVKDAFLVIACTNDRSVNEEVYEACNGRQLVNIADDPEKSTFTVPAVLHRGRLCLSVSTSGASPGLSKQIVERLESEFDESYEEYLEFLFTARKRILGAESDPTRKKQLLSQLLAARFAELTKQGEIKERDRLLNRLISEGKLDT